MVEGGRPRGLRADHDRRDLLRPRGRPPDRRRPDRAPAPRPASRSPTGRRPRPTPPRSSPRSAATWEAPMMAAMTLPNKIASYAEIKAVKKAAASLVPETEPERRKQVGQGRRRPREGPDPRDDPRPASGSTAASFDADPPDHLRGRLPAPHARLGALHARRDPGARHRDPRHLRRRADHRGVRGRERAHVPAPLQLPALLGRRDEVHARPLAPRHRPRQPRAPRARADAARPRTPSPTPCASSPTSSSPTAPPRWRPSAAARSR